MKDSELTDDELHERRKRVLGRLCMRAARVFQELATERIRDLGYDDYSIGDNAVLIHLEQSGNRISDIAQRAGVTKQAISQLVRDLERRGLVERMPDPTDGRAQIVKFTEAGALMMNDAFGVVFALDEEFADAMAPEGLEAVRQHLTALLQEYDPDGF